MQRPRWLDLFGRLLCCSLLLRRPRPGAATPPCEPRFAVPPMPREATSLNGVEVGGACFSGVGPHHVFVIGDWGGVVDEPGGKPVPADHRGPQFKAHHRDFVPGADDVAQLRVAEQMRRRAEASRPGYVLNVGDNFYWGGIAAPCGRNVSQPPATHQWQDAFEAIYTGDGLDERQWLGVLGNHDYGGYTFARAWDQVIAYTWHQPAGPGSRSRWLTPAQYWRTHAMYPDFTVDFFFVDSNIFVAMFPTQDQTHNLCSERHNHKNASCKPQGPLSFEDCPAWFGKLWVEQMVWLDHHLGESQADWQIVLTHFPPFWGHDDWEYLSRKHGIDIIISGHTHKQELHHGDEGNFLRPTAYVISGGGGGITSEGLPSADGYDDQYGFMDMTLSKDMIQIQSISHGGVLRMEANVTPRHAVDLSKDPLVSFQVADRQGAADATPSTGSVAG